MTEIIQFPPRDGDDEEQAGSAEGVRQAIPYDLIEAAADILNEVLSSQKGKALRAEDWARIRRACNFIDGAESVAREQGLPSGGK